MFSLVSRTLDDTLALGRLIGQLAPPPPATLCITLDGPLGTGKTQLSRGIAEGAIVSDPNLVSSPTYVLLNIYQGPKPVFHLDAYRIHSPEDFTAIGFDELLAGGGGGGQGSGGAGGIVIIEWSERIADLLPPDRLAIHLQHGAATESETIRQIEIKGTGTVSASLLQEIQRRWPPL